MSTIQFYVQMLVRTSDVARNAGSSDAGRWDGGGVLASHFLGARAFALGLEFRYAEVWSRLVNADLTTREVQRWRRRPVLVLFYHDALLVVDVFQHVV